MIGDIIDRGRDGGETGVWFAEYVQGEVMRGGILHFGLRASMKKRESPLVFDISAGMRIRTEKSQKDISHSSLLSR